MAIPYFMGHSMMFIGYLIVSSIQLGATIDYAILLTNNYLEARKTKVKREASRIAVTKSLPSIITSGGILVVAAFLIKWCSTITAVSQIGELIGRGALISIVLVVFFLPHILVLFDKIIEFTDFNHIKNRSKARHQRIAEKVEKIKNKKKGFKIVSKTKRKHDIKKIGKERKKNEAKSKK
ncbi:MAG: MMPL family transporter [Clostridia bacterium]|nr:MMPL family transporter [Clostridia bacterium]